MSYESRSRLRSCTGSATCGLYHVPEAHAKSVPGDCTSNSIPTFAAKQGKRDNIRISGESVRTTRRGSALLNTAATHGRC